MHTLHSIVAIFGLMLMTSACSSDLEEAQPLPVGNAGSDAVFGYYDVGKDLFVTADDLYEREKFFLDSVIKSKEQAADFLSEYDMNGDGKLDNVEFTGVVNVSILSGVMEQLHRSEKRGLQAAPSAGHM